MGAICSRTNPGTVGDRLPKMQNRRTCGKVIVEQWQATDNGICVGENEQEKGYSLQCTRTNGRVLFVQDRNCYGPGINWNEADLYDEDSAVLDNTMAGKDTTFTVDNWIGTPNRTKVSS